MTTLGTAHPSCPLPHPHAAHSPHQHLSSLCPLFIIHYAVCSLPCPQHPGRHLDFANKTCPACPGRRSSGEISCRQLCSSLLGALINCSHRGWHFLPGRNLGLSLTSLIFPCCPSWNLSLICIEGPVLPTSVRPPTHPHPLSRAGKRQHGLEEEAGDRQTVQGGLCPPPSPYRAIWLPSADPPQNHSGPQAGNIPQLHWSITSSNKYRWKKQGFLPGPFLEPSLNDMIPVRSCS